ncbi:hypothetical protein DPMN_034722 [Dreissena polymorpha]|uniref:Uncharacterized protein n=1 Tax=Dreissena polymorpha TaxID=45954 RepID=A0A9D4M816_DREPO|nr:hypothetical protein DPMN_034722 [Dreissena polymorpha]
MPSGARKLEHFTAQLKIDGCLNMVYEFLNLGKFLKYRPVSSRFVSSLTIYVIVSGTSVAELA